MQTSDNLVTRYAASFALADDHRLSVETRSYSGDELKRQTVERIRALAAAHREQATVLTAQEMAMRPAPDAAQAYPADGGDAW